MAKSNTSWEESIRTEIEEIKKHRLSESEKAGYDIGSQAAAMNWIEKHGADFREHWELEDDMWWVPWKIVFSFNLFVMLKI